MAELLSPVVQASGKRTAPLRICLVTGRLGLGGAEKQVVLLAEGLLRRGADVTVAVLAGEGPRDPALVAAGVPVVHLGRNTPHAPTARRLLALPGVVLRLAWHLRRTRPQVVHAFLYRAQVLGAVAARLARVPVFVAGRRGLAPPERDRWLARAARLLASRGADLQVVDAHAVAEWVREAEAVPDDRLEVISSGLPPSAFAPASPARLNTSRPVLLCVANLRRLKGHADLLEAVALLRDRGRPCTLALAGEGPERGALNRLASELRVDVRLLGARADIDRLLARADAVVLPSLREGMSNAVMEAMAAGKPIVATAVGGTPQLLADGRGVLVPPGDPRLLADALSSVLDDPERAALMGFEARDWSRRNLTAEATIQRHVALYERLVDRRSAARAPARRRQGGT